MVLEDEALSQEEIETLAANYAGFETVDEHLITIQAAALIATESKEKQQEIMAHLKKKRH